MFVISTLIFSIILFIFFCLQVGLLGRPRIFPFFAGIITMPISAIFSWLVVFVIGLLIFGSTAEMQVAADQHSQAAMNLSRVANIIAVFVEEVCKFSAVWICFCLFKNSKPRFAGMVLLVGLGFGLVESIISIYSDFHMHPSSSGQVQQWLITYICQRIPATLMHAYTASLFAVVPFYSPKPSASWLYSFIGAFGFHNAFNGYFASYLETDETNTFFLYALTPFAILAACVFMFGWFYYMRRMEENSLGSSSSGTPQAS